MCIFQRDDFNINFYIAREFLQKEYYYFGWTIQWLYGHVTKNDYLTFTSTPVIRYLSSV